MENRWFAKLAKLDVYANPVGINPKGESIVMKGEDWIGIIYWDGNAFRWKEVILNEGD